MPSPQLRFATLLPGAAPLHHESGMGPGSCPPHPWDLAPHLEACNGDTRQILSPLALPELGTRDPEPKVVAPSGIL